MQQKYKENPNNLKALTSTRKELRNRGTSAGAVLWLSLKGRQIEGMRWRRQFGVGPYILSIVLSCTCVSNWMVQSTTPYKVV